MKLFIENNIPKEVQDDFPVPTEIYAARKGNVISLFWKHPNEKYVHDDIHFASCFTRDEEITRGCYKSVGYGYWYNKETGERTDYKVIDEQGLDFDDFTYAHVTIELVPETEEEENILFGLETVCPTKWDTWVTFMPWSEAHILEDDADQTLFERQDIEWTDEEENEG